MVKSAPKIVTDAILGLDFRIVRVNGKSYKVDPPTIWKLAGAANRLVPVAKARSMIELVGSQENLSALASALSWLIVGSDELAEELSKGTMREVSNGLLSAYDLLSPQDFLMPLDLARNVVNLTAVQKL